MKPIATWCFAPYKGGRSIEWNSIESFFACAKRSIRLMTSHYGRVTLYCDRITHDVFRTLMGDELDIIVSHEGLFNTVPIDQWTYTKIHTLKQQYEPYIHFDLDFQLLKPIDDQLARADAVCQWIEPIDDGDIKWDQTYNLQKAHKFYPTWHDSLTQAGYITRVPNTGILMMNDMNLHEDYMELYNQVMPHLASPLITDLNIAPHHRIAHSVAVEQQLLGLAVQQGGYDVASLIPLMSQSTPPLNDTFVHFMGTWKRNVDVSFIADTHDKFITPHIDDSVNQAAEYYKEINQ